MMSGTGRSWSNPEQSEDTAATGSGTRLILFFVFRFARKPKAAITTAIAAGNNNLFSKIAHNMDCIPNLSGPIFAMIVLCIGGLWVGRKGA